MPTQRAQRKIQEQGASTRGALTVKTEPREYDLHPCDTQSTQRLEAQVTQTLHPDSTMAPVQPESRQLLKQRIIQKRRARGEEEIEVRFQKPVKHELSPEEIERRERRKEQNRRAARKCRQKKKLLQVDVAVNFSQMHEQNQLLEEEIATLKREKAELEKALHDHVTSGRCQQVKTELHDSACSPCPPYIPPSSTSSPQTLLTSSPMPVTSLPLPMTSQEPTSFDHRQYLQDIGPIEPSETFMDLGNLVAEELRAAPTAPPEPQCGGFDALKVLDDLTPVSSMCLAQLLSPISPAADRHSVSSVSSEWSTISDQSRGFCPEGYGDPASHQRLSELGMRDGQMDEQSLYQGIPLRQPFSLCVEDEVDDSDDVFGEFTETLPCEDMFRQYCA